MLGCMGKENEKEERKEKKQNKTKIHILLSFALFFLIYSSYQMVSLFLLNILKNN